jgi:hypothetical protein
MDGTNNKRFWWKECVVYQVFCQITVIHDRDAGELTPYRSILLLFEIRTVMAMVMFVASLRN